FLGSYPDFARADALSQTAVDDHPERYESWLARADYLGAVHRFEDALEAVGEAERLGAPVQDERRAGYWLATGQQSDRVLAVRERALAQAETYLTLVGL